MKPKDISPWLCFPDGHSRDLVFAYEMVLTEMRAHARSNRTIKQWVARLDSARDEFVRASPVPADSALPGPKL